MAIMGGRPDERRIHPNLVVRDATKALAWYKRAFGGEEIYRYEYPDGKIFHAQLRIGDSYLLITDEAFGRRAKPVNLGAVGLPVCSPESLGSTTVVLELYVDDVDTAVRRALDAGATIRAPVSYTILGDRSGQITDPFGNVWSLATVCEVLTPAQIERRLREEFGALV